MAIEPGKITSASISIPGRDRDHLRVQDDDPVNFNTPKLSPSSVMSLEGTEKLGVPLKTPWTFWYDR